MFRSIRWTLQMWHAAILAAVLVVFGCVVYRFLRDAAYQRIDEDLNRTAFRVDRSLRFGPPPNGPEQVIGGDVRTLDRALQSGNLAAAQQAFTQFQKDLQARQDRRTRGGRGRSRDAARLDATEGRKSGPPEAEADVRADNPRPARSGDSGSPAAEPASGARRPRPARIELADDLKSLFDGEGDVPYYYVVWDGDGGQVLKSKFAPDVPLPTLPSAEARPGRREPPGRVVRQEGPNREAVRRARGGMNILVGRSIESDLSALYEKGWILAAAGTAVLAGGLLGGHWFSRRAIRPIEAISTTAAEISLSNLSQRIDVTGTETELTGLARTLNQMFDRLEAAFAQQVRFTADASHELRTPLAVILSHSELALGKERPAEELREAIETCRRSALRMKSLVESLLTLARFDSGELQLERRTFDLSRVAGDCVGLVRPLAEQRRIVLSLDLAPVTLQGDPDRIAQVITNLLTNAIRYNHDRGRVVFSTKSSDNEAILTVSDTGIGIPPEHLPHIFQRFYRVDTARSRKDGAIGLGLAICKSIVEAHGGRIVASSSAEGGTTFEVRFPRNRFPAADETRNEPAARRADPLAATLSS